MSAENYYLLKGMEKYFPDFKREEYENKSEDELIDICREYYNDHLPVDLQTWLNVNIPDARLKYRMSAIDSTVFIRDIINSLFVYKEYPILKNNLDVKTEIELRNEFTPIVISTHMSKSVTLPVMEINLKSVGVKILLRYNFYDWNISVESEYDIECNFKEIFSDNDYKYCFCQGFPEGRKYPPYKDNHKNFTCCIDNHYKLYTFMWLLKDYLYDKSRDYFNKEKQDGSIN